MTTTPATTTPAGRPISLHPDYAADLADLLRFLSSWIDAEHHHLELLLDRHGYDIDGLRVALDLHAGLLDPGEATF
jgi:hypothetical protein